MREAEGTAASTLEVITEAQRAFRKTGGRGGYATDLNSLMQPCAGETHAVLPPTLPTAAVEYTVVVRAARGAAAVGADCHGRPTATDFYVSAQPLHEWAGTQAMAATSWGRIYLFFDGLAPTEHDIEAGGLAVPLDTLGTFKIP
jgi:hypothetical protein